MDARAYQAGAQTKKGMKHKLTQLERIRERLHKYGFITRNQCLANFISRLSGRIADLEAEGYVFKAEWKGGDYCYTLLSINGAPYHSAAERAQLMRDNAEAIRFFDNYKSPTTA